MALELIVTNVGLNKIANASAENPLVIKDFALGDGNGSTINPDPTMTSLVNEQIRLGVNSVSVLNNQVTAKCLLALNTLVETAFTSREIGLFDNEDELIAIGQTTEEYIPASEENIPTENLYTLVFTFENADASIVVEVNPELYALQSDLEAVNQRVTVLESNQLSLNNGLIGFLEWENKDQTYKDQLIVKRGVFTWALLDESNILNIADYPILFANSNAEEIKNEDGTGTGTFKVRSLKDGTIRHLALNDAGRLLGSYQEDALQEHKHGYSRYSQGVYGNLSAGTQAYYLKFTTNAETGNPTGRTADETRMKNTAVQKYVLAKIEY